MALVDAGTLVQSFRFSLRADGIIYKGYMFFAELKPNRYTANHKGEFWLDDPIPTSFQGHWALLSSKGTLMLQITSGCALTQEAAVPTPWIYLTRSHPGVFTGTDHLNRLLVMEPDERFIVTQRDISCAARLHSADNRNVASEEASPLACPFCTVPL